MGSKNKNESNGVAVADGLQLMLAINLDDLESIETAAESAAPEAPVVNTSAPVLDSDDAVAKTLDTSNSTEDAMFWVGVGVDVYNLMVDEKNLAPGSY
jgi:hypothetical protein